MSKIAISPNNSGTGVFTLAAPNSNTNRTLDLPDASGTIALTSDISGTGITATTGSAPYYGARAWVNFNGTGTVAIRASANVSSITDNGTGDYTVNFTTAMPDANYAVAGACGEPNTTLGALASRSDGYLTTSARVQANFANGSVFDPTAVNVVIFR